MTNNVAINERRFIETTKIDVETHYKQITDIVCVYNVRVYLKDSSHIFEKRVVLKDIWRLCFVNELDQLEASPVMFATEPDRELDKYFLFKKDIIEALRQDYTSMYDSAYSIGNIQNKFEQYEYAMNNDIDENSIVIAKIDANHDNLYGLEYDVPFAKAMHFDYPVLTDRDYYLGAAVEYLVNRSDVILHTVEESVIQRANAFMDEEDEDCPTYFYAEFEWHPSDEDWQRYCESGYFNSYERRHYIADEILGLNKYRISR